MPWLKASINEFEFNQSTQDVLRLVDQGSTHRTENSSKFLKALIRLRYRGTWAALVESGNNVRVALIQIGFGADMRRACRCVALAIRPFSVLLYQFGTLCSRPHPSGLCPI